MRKWNFCLVLVVFILSVSVFGNHRLQAVEGSSENVRVFIVGNEKREAIVLPPSKKTEQPPIVFAWHGHGGKMEGSVHMFDVQTAWPEAIVVYPQGLLSPSATDPHATKSGWQFAEGDQGNRDLKFFDAMYAQLWQDFHFDKKRVYSLGFSNGGIFSYLLWHSRHDRLAAVSICEAILNDDNKPIQPLPALIFAGKLDTTAPFQDQQKSIQFVRGVEGIPPNSQPNHQQNGVRYFQGSKADLAVHIHDGGHEYPAGSTDLVVPFFKHHAQP